MAVIPEYISKSFFEKALKNGLNLNDLAVTDAQISMGTNTGDNYCSDIYRARVEYTTKNGSEANTISLIVKSMPYMELRGPVFDELQVFDKEIQMYTRTLPKMSQLINNEPFCAKYFYSTRDPVKLIVFEDLKERGFRMADRNEGLDMDHCALVMKKLGKLHASSYALAQNDIKSMENFGFGMVKTDIAHPELYIYMFEKGVEALAQLTDTWKGFETITEKLKVLQVNYVKKLQHQIKVSQKECSFKVLNHGDVWVNNFLYKYKDGKPQEVIFVDYQLCHYTTPGMDLNYFINTSPNNEIRQNQSDQLIQMYYNEFASTLAHLNLLKIPTLEDLYREISRCEFYGFMAISGILPIFLLDKSESKDSHLEKVGDAEEGDEIRNAMYYNKKYQTAAKAILPRFNEHGVLDHLPCSPSNCRKQNDAKENEKVNKLLTTETIDCNDLSR